MKCPHCSMDIKEALIMAEAARINGRKGVRKLDPEQARQLAEKSHAARRANKEAADDTTA